MLDPKRFAGYESPGRLVSDPALSREQKIGALLAWASALQRRGTVTTSEEAVHSRLAAEIEKAIARLRAEQG